MSKPSKAARAERAEAIEKLRKWCLPGTTVYTILDHVSSSGMSRAIRVVVPYVREDGTVAHRHPNYAVGKALDLRHWKRNGHEQDALVVGGCGMDDMGFHLVNSLSQVLWGGRVCPEHGCTYGAGRPDCQNCHGSGYDAQSGYACLGPGECPSNYHVHHRNTIRCEGPAPGAGLGSFCYRPDRFSSRFPVPDGWPMRAHVITVPGDDDPPITHTIQIPQACVTQNENGDDIPPVVCPRCQGEGSYPNPAGPERFDLVHIDGYALRHRWL